MTLSPDPLQSGGLADDDRWRAVLGRDASADGLFVYAVRTTGIYCRPSCPSRRPRRQNVSFHPSPAAAERAGFRACRRCRPDVPSVEDRHAALVTKACRAIETTDPVPPLADLARDAGLCSFHFHRIFLAKTGVTPRAYAQAHRSRRVREDLTAGKTVTEALHGAGFGSSGRFYESEAHRLGMTPRQYRAGGADMTIRYAFGTSTLGHLIVAATDLGVCALFLGDDPATLVDELRRRFPRASIGPGDGAFQSLVERAVGFVEEPARGLDLPLDIRGTAFQRRVWDALLAIPCGTTSSYAGIATAIGRPRATRAVAQACASNPIALAIPCHRVVRSDGQLSGYRWGVARKATLLSRESDGPAPPAAGASPSDEAQPEGES